MRPRGIQGRGLCRGVVSIRLFCEMSLRTNMVVLAVSTWLRDCTPQLTCRLACRPDDPTTAYRPVSAIPFLLALGCTDRACNSLMHCVNVCLLAINMRKAISNGCCRAASRQNCSPSSHRQALGISYSYIRCVGRHSCWIVCLQRLRFRKFQVDSRARAGRRCCLSIVLVNVPLHREMPILSTFPYRPSTSYSGVSPF